MNISKIAGKVDPLIGLQVVVNDEKSKRFGQVGRVTHVIEPEQPLYMVRFADGCGRALSAMSFSLFVGAA